VLVVEWRLPSTYAAPCVIKKLRYLQKIRVLPSGSLFLTPDFRTFRHGTSIVATCCKPSSTKMDAQRDKLDRRQSQLKPCPQQTN